MKILKTFTSLIAAASLCFGMAFADSLNAAVDSEQMLSGMGVLSGVKDALVTVQILYPHVTEESIKTVTNESFASVFSNVFQVSTDEGGNFTIPSYKLGSTSGRYSVRVMSNKAGALPVWFENAFLYISPDFTQIALSKLAAQQSEAEKFVTENADVLFKDVSLYEKLSPSSAAEAVRMTVAERDNPAIDGYASVEQAEYVFNLAVMLCRMKEADNAAETEDIFVSTCDGLKLGEHCSPYLTCKNTLSQSDRQAIIEAALANGDNTSVGDYICEIADNSLIKAVKGVSTYANAEGILTSNEKWLGTDLSAYKALTDKRTVNEAVVTSNAVTVPQLAAVLEQAVAEAQKSAASVSGGKNGGTKVSGGGSKVSATVTAPDVISGPESEPEVSVVGKEFLFDDMESYEWAKEAVQTLCGKGIVNGVSAEKFAPGQNVTREEFVKLLYTAFYGNEFSYDCVFEDIKSNDWFYPYVCSAADKGLVTGISDTSFGSGLSITRQDMTVMAYRFIIASGYEFDGAASVSFADSGDIAGYAVQAVNAMSGEGMVSGMGDGRFAPDSYSNRAQAAQLVYNIIKITDGGGVQ